MLSRLKRWSALGGMSLLAITLSAGCGMLNPASGADPSSAVAVDPPASAPDVQPVVGATATPATTRRAGARAVAVQRAAITEIRSLDGRVTAEERVPITYPGRAMVADVLVKVGQSVNEGDPLLELQPPQQGWAVDVLRQLNLAKARLETAQAGLADAQAQASARQQAAAQQAALNQRHQQQAIADAATGLRQAQDTLATVQAGASAAERQAAQNAVEAAQAVLQKAQDNLDKLSGGPDQAAIRARQRDATNAQIALTKAQAGLDALTRGPDPAAMRDAQAQVQRAQAQLALAQAAKIDPKADQATARIQHDQSIQDAELAIQNAQDKVARLEQPAPEVDVRAAKQRVQDAQDALAAATDKLSSVQAGADEGTLNAAQTAVDKAQQSLELAQAHAADVNGRPTKSELTTAQDQVRKAQAVLDTASRATAATGEADGSAVSAAQQAVDRAQAEVNTLQDTLAKTRLDAPFNGTVVAVSTKPDAIITASTVVFLLAKPGPAVVHVDGLDDQASPLTVGQAAEVQFENGTVAPATVSAIIPADTSTAAPAGAQYAGAAKSASADFHVDWPEGLQPKFGTLVQVNVALQQKQDVLVVPKSALHQGDPITVQVQDGTAHHNVSVQVGITTDDRAEILSGLTEGQIVLAGTSS